MGSPATAPCIVAGASVKFVKPPGTMYRWPVKEFLSIASVST